MHLHDVADAVGDERACIVDEHRLRDAAEVPERTGESLAPVIMALSTKWLHEAAPRIAEHRDEHGRDLGSVLGLAMGSENALHHAHVDVDPPRRRAAA